MNVASGQADKEQTQQRVEVVYRLILQGDSIPNIVEKCGKTWGVKKSQAYGYVKRARTLIRKEAERIRTQAFDEHLAARRRMRKEAHDAKDGRLAFDLLRDEAKLAAMVAELARVRELLGPPGAAMRTADLVAGLEAAPPGDTGHRGT